MLPIVTSNHILLHFSPKFDQTQKSPEVKRDQPLLKMTPTKHPLITVSSHILAHFSQTYGENCEDKCLPPVF